LTSPQVSYYTFYSRHYLLPGKKWKPFFFVGVFLVSSHTRRVGSFSLGRCLLLAVIGIQTTSILLPPFLLFPSVKVPCKVWHLCFPLFFENLNPLLIFVVLEVPLIKEEFKPLACPFYFFFHVFENYYFLECQVVRPPTFIPPFPLLQETRSVTYSLPS